MLEPDRIVSNYQVRHVLGQGGMGTVFLARDVRLGRRVALKVVERLGTTDPEAFLQEARLTATVNHPNIVTVYDVGEVDGQPWVALEYVEGRSLRSMVGQDRIPPLQAARIVQAIASALAAAHGAGIVHRDLKPENVIVGNDGRPRVLDFGLALQLADANPTQAAIVGTLGYIAPETWRRQAAGPPADMWALGITFYELLAGHHPWQSELDQGMWALCPALLAAQEPPPLPDEDDLPAGLADLVYRCLATDPAARPDASVVTEEMERLLRRVPAGADACPFRGLLPFEAEHAPWFFGREADVAALVEQVEAHPRLALTGPSGVGKSSLVHAGVVPRLRERGWWLVLGMRPGPTPLATLARVVQRRLDSSWQNTPSKEGPSSEFASGMWLEQGDLTDPHIDDPAGPTSADVLEDTDLAAELATAPGRLGVILQQLAEKRFARVLLVVDQLEEIETQGASAEERAVFLAALASAAQDPSDAVRVVVTVRDDHLGRLAAVGGHALLERVEVVRPLDRAGLASVLTEPLDATGHRFDDPTLVDEMIDAVQDEPGALPLLQFTARRLWDLRDKDRRLLRRADHDALGGVAGALARHAEDVVQQLPSQDHAVLRVLLLRLVHEDGTRRPAAYDGVIQGITPLETARAVRERLLGARLLVVREGEGGARSVELAHESLAVRWERLRRWRNEARDEVRVAADVEEAARLWDRRGRPEVGLWGGEALDEARRALTEGAVGLTELGAAFLAASRSRDLRARTVRRRLVAAAIVTASLVTVGSVGASIAYSRQRADALREAEAAADARGLALVSSAEAAWEAEDKLDARARLRAGFERLDSPAARALWTRVRRDPLLWHQYESTASFQMQPTPDGTHAVVASAGGLVRLVDLATRRMKSLRVGLLDFAAVAARDDLALVVGVRFDGSWVRWFPDEDRWIEGPQLLDGQAAQRAWFAGDGTLVLLSQSEDGRRGDLWLADTAQPALAVHQPLPDGQTFATTSHAQQRMVTFGADARVASVWTLRPRFAHERDIPLPEGFVADSVHVRDDGDLLAVLGRRPAILDGDGRLVRELSPLQVRVRGGGFAQDGGRLVAVGDDGSLVAWDLSTGASVASLPRGVPGTTLHGAETSSAGLLVFSDLYGFGALDLSALAPAEDAPGHSGRLDGIDASRDGTWVASGDSDGVVVLRDATSGRQVAAAGPLDGAINAVRFAPSSRLVAAAANAGTAAVWTVPELREVARIRLEDDVLAAELLDDATLRALTWSGLVRDVRIDGPTPVVVTTWQLGSPAYDLRVSPQGDTFVALTDGRVVRLGDDGTLSEPLLTHGDAPHSLALGGGVVASAGFDDTVRLTVPPGVLPAPTSGRLALSRDGARLAVPAASGHLQVFALDGGPAPRLAPLVAPVEAVAIAPDGTIFGAGHGGTVMAWEAASGAPRWRGVALSTHPPAALSQDGWQAFDDAVPTAPWAQVLHTRGRLADLTSSALCALTLDGQVTRWDGDTPAATFEAPAPDALEVAVLGAGCAVLEDEGVRWVGPDGDDRRLGAARALARHGDRVEALDDARVVTWTGDAVPAGTRPVSPQATASWTVQEASCAGFSDGQVLCDDRPALRGTPSDAVTVGKAWRDDLVLLGFANGVVGAWSTSSGAALLTAKLDGAIARVEAVPGGLLALSITGQARRLDTTAFDLPWCDVLRQVTAAIPVTWQEEQVVRAEPLTGICAASDPAP